MSIRLILERVENLQPGDVFRKAHHGSDLDFTDMPWRRVTDVKPYRDRYDLPDTNYLHVHDDAGDSTYGECFRRLELVQKQVTEGD